LAAASFPPSAQMLGNAALPLALWPLVFAAAGLAWAVAEGLARVVWREPRGGAARR
jgi:hypothetical protein